MKLKLKLKLKLELEPDPELDEALELDDMLTVVVPLTVTSASVRKLASLLFI